MSDNEQPRLLSIKKYSNRRFYDTTRSRHVTMGEMHDLIAAGYDLTIVDGTSGDEITNVVLTQIILERDTPKLSMFPSNVLHEMIRTQQEFLGNVVERFFAQVLDSHKSSQDRWRKFVENTIGFNPASVMNPMDWTRSMMSTFTGQPKAPDPVGGGGDREGEGEMDVLRRQVEELTRQVGEMNRKGDG